MWSTCKFFWINTWTNQPPSIILMKKLEWWGCRVTHRRLRYFISPRQEQEMLSWQRNSCDRVWSRRSSNRKVSLPNAEIKWHQIALPDMLDLSIQCGWYIISAFMYFWNLSINIFDFPTLKRKRILRSWQQHLQRKKFFSISVSELQYAKFNWLILLKECVCGGGVDNFKINKK